MNIAWDQIQERYNGLIAELALPALDQKRRDSLQKEASYLRELLDRYERISSLEVDLNSIKSEYEHTTDSELRELFKLEIDELREQINKVYSEIEMLILPTDPHDNRSVFLEIRAGAGGQEAALFAADLVKMYTNYALAKNWKVSIVDMSSTDLGGIREAVLHIQGKNVYEHLRYEIGVHRVQRVPKTETSGRIHTSTATVAVLPEAKDADIQINSNDLRIDTYRAGGAGGQHVNKTDSAVRITHIPTGVVVACQDERSQHKNKAKALKMLQSRILVAEQERHAKERSAQRKEMVGTGMRAEKVRTYNFPQNRVTDHQANITLKKLDLVMEGDLDEIVDALRQKARQDRKKDIPWLIIE